MNMSYCRFENTAADLQDCINHWNDDEKLSHDEQIAKDRIIFLAEQILEFEAEKDE